MAKLHTFVVLAILAETCSRYAAGSATPNHGDLRKFLDVDSIPAESLVPHVRRKRFIPRLGGKHGLRWDEIETIVLKHNVYRAGVSPTATNMRFLRWDVRLQEFAQTYAYQCNYEHQRWGSISTVDPEWFVVGENLWAGSHYRARTAADAVFRWHDEVRWFNYTTLRCDPGKVCGHYTQIAWAETYTIGCGMAECTGIADQDNAAIDNILVCNYGEAGNYVNEKPYKAGAPCSQCPGGYRGGCEDNLCTPTTTCAGISCENGGVLNTTTCLCHCPPGVLGAFCGGEIQATLDYLASLTTPGPQLTTMETDDGGGVTTEAAPTTTCAGITCEHGGVLNTTTCLCRCPPGIPGASCRGEIPITSDRLASMTTTGPHVTSTDTGQDLQSTTTTTMVDKEDVTTDGLLETTSDVTWSWSMTTDTSRPGLASATRPGRQGLAVGLSIVMCLTHI